mmetsp:Transcript_68470/g.150555  ORF Transcript_68470/g.150555 Transcript_68470/m.150555 type:complete len:103 (-) Transcript_68470:80-388(-)
MRLSHLMGDKWGQTNYLSFFVAISYEDDDQPHRLRVVSNMGFNVKNPWIKIPTDYSHHAVTLYSVLLGDSLCWQTYSVCWHLACHMFFFDNGLLHHILKKCG